MEIAWGLVGLPLDEFTKRAADEGYTVRVVVRDGEDLPRSLDHDSGRINVVVDGARVVAIKDIG